MKKESVEQKNYSIETDKEIITNSLGYRCVVEEVFDGYEVGFFSEDDAEKMVQEFWKLINPNTEKNFRGGMWTPQQTLSYGPRTEWRNIKIRDNDHKKGVKAKVFFGGNVQAIPDSATRALQILGILKRQGNSKEATECIT